MTAITVAPVREQRADVYQVPLSRVVHVELRKMFDTRSGFWLMASIVIAALVATVATIAFAPDQDLTYYTFAKGDRIPDDGRPTDHRDPVDHRRVEPAQRPDHVVAVNEVRGPLALPEREGF